jgi:ferredoxin
MGLKIMKNVEINYDLCKACGICSDICPNKIFKKGNNKTLIYDEHLHLCFKCGQCMAICPTGAVAVEGLSAERDFFELPKETDREISFFNMIKTRRAVRNFQDKSVPKELLEKIVDAISFAPPAFPPVKIELTVVQNTELIRKALQYMIEDYEFLYKGFRNPFIRLFIKKKIGKDGFNGLKTHIIPMMKERLPGLKAGTEDTITRNAPAMILFHVDRNESSYSEDINIAVTYGFLAVHALGLGGSAMTLIYPDIENNKILRKLFSIPEKNEVAGSIIIGYPKYKFKKGIRRNLKKVTWL